MNQAMAGLGLRVRVRVSLSYNLSTVFRDVPVRVWRFEVKSRPFSISPKNGGAAKEEKASLKNGNEFAPPHSGHQHFLNLKTPTPAQERSL